MYDDYDDPKMDIIREEEYNRIIVGNQYHGYITSQTVEANLLYEILQKLEEIIGLLNED